MSASKVEIVTKWKGEAERNRYHVSVRKRERESWRQVGAHRRSKNDKRFKRDN